MAFSIYIKKNNCTKVLLCVKFICSNIECINAIIQLRSNLLKLLNDQCFDIAAYRSLGCWKDYYFDESSRAIPGLEGKSEILDGQYASRSDPVEKCYKAAVSYGYTVFALQNGGWCASSATAQKTYQIYGPATNCGDHGKGGQLANDVYEIV